MHLLIKFPQLVLVLLALLNILYEANLLAEIANYFPVNCRYSAIAITLNLTNGIAGGFAPLIALFLIHKTGVLISPMFYIIGLCVISGCGLIFSRKIKFFIKE
jgi:MHS family proline/betaine transporter-like MFS transporter